MIKIINNGKLRDIIGGGLNVNTNLNELIDLIDGYDDGLMDHRRRYHKNS